jgi:hypothetical protein
MKAKNLEEKEFIRIDGVWVARDVLFTLERIAKKNHQDLSAAERGSI